MSSNDEHLHALSTSLDSLEARTRELAAGLTEEQLNWSPERDRWSMAQCFEHLVVTGAQVHLLLRRAIEEAREHHVSGGTVPYRSTIIGAWMLRTFSDTTGRRRYRSPRIFRPAARPAPGAAERLGATQRELLLLIASSEGLDLTRIKVHSPASRLVRMNLGDAFAVQVAHIARHLAQANRVREQPDFPERAA